MEVISPRRKSAPAPASAKPWPARWSGAVLMSEQRRDRRMPADHPVTLCSTDDPRRTLPGRVRNISRGGLYVETTLPASHSDRNSLLIRFDLPGDREGAGLWLNARIVHRRAGGLGLMLDRSQPLAAERIQSLLAICQT